MPCRPLRRGRATGRARKRGAPKNAVSAKRLQKSVSFFFTPPRLGGWPGTGGRQVLSPHAHTHTPTLMSRPRRRNVSAPDRFGDTAADVDALLGSESGSSSGSDDDGSRCEFGWGGEEEGRVVVERPQKCTSVTNPCPHPLPPHTGTPRPPGGGIYVYRLLRAKDLEAPLKGRTVRCGVGGVVVASQKTTRTHTYIHTHLTIRSTSSGPTTASGTKPASPRTTRGAGKRNLNITRPTKQKL